MPWADRREIAFDYLCVTWFPPARDVADAISLAESVDTGGFEYEDGETANPPFTDIPLAPGKPYVRVYIPRARAELADTIGQVCDARGWTWTQSVVKSQDWASAWKTYYRPQIIGDGYAIVPAWYEESPEDASHTLWLDPGMAFGTGTHATTRMCLEALASMDLKGKRVLDVGAGSGILGLFAVLKGAAQAVLIEPDPVAVDAIFHNARLNSWTHRMTVIPGTLADLTIQPFDVICLNIVWDVIQAEWFRVQHYLAQRTTLLLSGLLAERRHDVKVMVSQTGQSIRRVEESDGWILAVVGHDSSQT